MKISCCIFLLFLFSSTTYALKPDSLYINTPGNLGLNFMEQSIQTSDGYTLNTWIIFADSSANKKTTLILAYGDSGNMSYYLNQAAILSQTGYDMVLFDYRGFGKSSPFELNPNQLYYNEFATDLLSVLQWSKMQYPKNKIGVWAFSMGTIMTTLALQSEPIDFFIGEGFVSDPHAIQKKILELKSKEILLPSGQESYDQKVNNLQLPMLLFAGTDDSFTTVEDSKRIAQKRKNRVLVIFKGNHLQGFPALTKKFYGDQYIARMEKFIRKVRDN